ncbi:MAG: phenylalanine--tRNA ligase subunit alpha [Kordiimonadaceae bacterium]|jgi:phenylalanyl-tRNA synthetase alpha chain|nr:phenylalanine--tRNA ligase subunit alpha [Kordiimonadaceae bacterium]MBT6036743.1 phenylalanine--tRNA ligase subunit alpha [Kordiimonadaceae bacterium]MBT6328377.1 phenylalanine--tRNA ligase subunit alpha [Kordiimonadaceae bacterium]MBT7583812.1 phenylalanine--tRNA ligase subunit alpha [Kordiimonadaceae bacterium]
MQDLQTLESEIAANIKAATDLEQLEVIRIAELGKKGRVSLLMRELGKMSPDEKKEFGPKLNQLKNSLNDAVQDRKNSLEEEVLNIKLKSESVDISLSVVTKGQGSIHPISQVMDEVTEIFTEMGYSVAEGPEIEEDFYNFTALNIPEEHPARQMHDTFYFPEDEDGKRKVLRTHTSPVQIRTMMDGEPPYRIIAPGRTYRNDSDATHTPMFHQVEALVIDKDIHMGHLKWCIEEFCRKFFEIDNVKIRFRPSYFPFTEPSAEVDIGCSFKDGEVLIGEGDDWLEIMGCGMVNERVLENVNIDPSEYQGFAFGMGLDRIAMLKWGIPDLRDFFAADLRWLKHYGFQALDIPSLSTRSSSIKGSK